MRSHSQRGRREIVRGIRHAGTRVAMPYPAPRALFGWTALALAVLAARPARAQTIAPAFQGYQPERFVGGVDVGVTTRLMNLNPFGVNHDDCVRDMSLQFNLLVNGFSGQNAQVWATRSGDCTGQPARGINGIASCWLVSQGLTNVNIQQSTSQTFTVRVQDLVGPQNTSPSPSGLVHEGPSACDAQPSFAAVPITLWFLPIDSAGNAVGTPYSQQISTDMVGPPAPTGVSKSAGDTLLIVTWVANSDLDTVGYDLFIDPPPGSAPIDAAAGPQLYCPDSAAAGMTSGSSGAPSGSASGGVSGSASGTMSGSASGTASGTMSGSASGMASGSASGGPSGSTSGAISGSTSGAASGSGSTSGTAPTASDAGCFYVNFGSPIATGACASTVLTSGAVLDGSTTTGPVFDDAGNEIEGGSTTALSGGVSTIPCAYGIGLGSDCYSGGSITLTGESNGSRTITGLTNGTWYNVVVASVDGSGNVGPPSPEVCDYPAPVSDFWQTYRNAGGKAGGGFCALQALGAPAGASFALGVAGAGLLAAMRRRRRRVTK